MLSSLVGPKATIKVTPYQSVVFVHPPTPYESLDAENAPPKFQRLWGNVTLSLPKPREFTNLKVKLVAYYSVSIPGHSTESGVLAVFPAQIPIPDRLEAGDHSFAWSLEIPRTSAPYERCAYGHVHHKLEAIAEGSQGTIKDERALEVVVNPAAEGETMGLNERVEGFHPEVGAYFMSLSSGHVTVGGVVHYKLNLAGVPSDTRIHSITTSITQAYELRSHKKPEVKGKPSPHKRRVFRIDTTTPLRTSGTITPPRGANTKLSPQLRPSTAVITNGTVLPEGGGLVFVPQGESLEVSHVARMPDDDLLRATTQNGSTDAIIHISHELSIDIQFATAATKYQNLRSLRVERPIQISSCCCMLESLLLPSYDEAKTEIAPSTSFNRPAKLGCAMECICGYTLERLLLKTHAPLLKAHEDAAQGKDRGGSDEIFHSNKITQSPAASVAEVATN